MTGAVKTCVELCKKNETKSVHGRLRPVETLSANGDSLIPKIIEEFSSRYVNRINKIIIITIIVLIKNNCTFRLHKQNVSPILFPFLWSIEVVLS